MTRVEVQNVNGEKVVRFNADVFIIPNGLHRVCEYLSDSVKKSKAELATRVCELNGLEEFDIEHDRLIQLWFTSKELGSDNICRHGFGIIEDGKEDFMTPYDMEELPVKIFEGKSEGDTISIKVPDGDIILDMNVTLNQQDYRYKNFGTFDQCIEKLGARC